jgi:hypothetical protein
MTASGILRSRRRRGKAEAAALIAPDDAMPTLKLGLSMSLLTPLVVVGVATPPELNAIEPMGEGWLLDVDSSLSASSDCQSSTIAASASPGTTSGRHFFSMLKTSR